MRAILRESSMVINTPFEFRECRAAAIVFIGHLQNKFKVRTLIASVVAEAVDGLL